jgi:hypothetical protein
MKNYTLTLTALFLSFAMLTVLNAQEQPKVIEFTKDKFLQKQVEVERIDSAPAMKIEVADTLLKPYLLKFVHINRFYQSTRIIFSFTNRSASFVDNFWVTASLLDNRKSFLYREQSMFFTKVKQGETAKSEMICESIGADEIGYIVISPMLLEVDDNDQTFDIEQVEIVSDTLTNIVIDFESHLK